MKKLDTLLLCSVLLTFVMVSCNQNTKDWPSGEWIDLSYSYDKMTPFWPTAEGFKLDTVFEGMTEGNYYYSAFSFQMAEHGGTHIDAPVHFAEGKNTVDQITLDQLTGPGVLIDVREKVADYIDYQISVEDFENWEWKNGNIPEGSILLLRTGWGKFWPDKSRYLGTDRTGPSAVALLHFPGLSSSAAQWLVENRNIKAVGIDTPSIDYGRSGDFMAHRILMEQNIPAFENLAQLEKLPLKDFYIFAFPMKIKGGSGGPLRIAAFLAK